ncbi:MAG: hypothetical protein U5R31_11185 [Acidimicrobiia bacterium]|nr:hypothetical protein [Acidimicrobiia bacterium]
MGGGSVLSGGGSVVVDHGGGGRRPVADLDAGVVGARDRVAGAVAVGITDEQERHQPTEEHEEDRHQHHPSDAGRLVRLPARALLPGSPADTGAPAVTGRLRRGGAEVLFGTRACRAGRLRRGGAEVLFGTRACRAGRLRRRRPGLLAGILGVSILVGHA